MANNFQFDVSKVTPYVIAGGPGSTELPLAPKNPERTEAERIAAARDISIENSKRSNLFERPASYWKDFAGNATSAWDADRLDYLLMMLRVPGRECIRFKSYDVRKASWGIGDAAVTMQRVRDMIDARIADLKISEAKVWERFNGSFEDRRAFELLSFEDQMEVLREPS